MRHKRFLVNDSLYILWLVSILLTCWFASFNSCHNLKISAWHFDSRGRFFFWFCKNNLFITDTDFLNNKVCVERNWIIVGRWKRDISTSMMRNIFLNSHCHLARWETDERFVIITFFKLIVVMVMIMNACSGQSFGGFWKFIAPRGWLLLRNM